MELLFVDTSAWLAHANRRDAMHRRVRAAMDEFAGRLITTNYVFDEILTLAAAGFGHDSAVGIGRLLRDPDVVQTVHLTPNHVEAAWQLFVARGDKQYSFTDCASFVVMKALGLSKAATCDAHFVQEGFVIVPE